MIGSTCYANGDFNFDGVIDASDYGLIDNAYQLQGTPLRIQFKTGANPYAGAAKHRRKRR